MRTRKIGGRFESLESRQMLTSGLVLDLNTTGERIRTTRIAAFNDGVLTRVPSTMTHAIWHVDGSAEEGTFLSESYDVEFGPQIGDIMYFTSDDKELWTTDGTPEGTVQVMAIEGRMHTFTALGDVVLFIGDDGVHGDELWRSDGTPDGTYMVKDIHHGPGGISTRSMTLVDGLMYFEADDGVSPPQLYASDGTAEGTRAITDFLGRDGMEGGSIVAWDQRFFFTATTAAAGTELWISDGTTVGTQMVVDIVQGEGNSARSSFPRELTMLGDNLYFVASDDVYGRELWTSDGTAAGTRLLADITPGSSSTSLQNLAVVGDQIYFSANGALWATDGTTAGTRLVTDEFANPYDLRAHESRLFFATRPDEGRDQLVRSDGTAEGTVAIVGPNRFHNFPRITSTPSGLYLEDGGFVMWRLENVEDTAATVVNYLNAPTLDSNPSFLARLDDGMLFRAIGGHSQLEQVLWSTDGTADNTSQLAAIGFDESGVVLGGKYLFAYDSSLWSTDGNSLGQAIYSAPGMVVRVLGEFGDRLFFSVQELALGVGDGSTEVWTTDGTADGTVMIIAGLPSSGLQLVEEDAGDSGEPRILLLADTGAIWATDGRPDGTVQVVDGAEGDFAFGLSPVGDRFLYMQGEGGSFHLWSTDGTHAGTGPIVDGLTTFPAGVHRDVYYFTSQSDEGTQLYRSDGTSEGTRETDLWSTSGLISTDDATYVVASENCVPAPGVDCDVKLWRIGDTPATNFDLLFAHTMRLHHASGSRLYFSRLRGGEHEFWVTDGTPAGTTQLASIGEASSRFVLMVSMVDFDGFSYFTVYDSDSEVWRTDGTPEGTGPAFDLSPGAEGAVLSPVVDASTGEMDLFVTVGRGQHVGPSLFRVAPDGIGKHVATPLSNLPNSYPLGVLEDTVLFSGHDPDVGQELMAFRPGPIPGDLNGDLEVTFADFLAMSANFGAVDASFAEGDFDGDGEVGFEDFLKLAGNFGVTHKPFELLG